MQKIAVIGMSCLFPGAETPGQFMKNLYENRDTTSLPTAEQMGVDPKAYYSSVKGVTDKFYSVRGGYIQDFSFDPSLYNLPASELENLDNIYQWSLYVARAALQDADYLQDPASLSGCGVIMGNLSFPTRSSNKLSLPIYYAAIEGAVRKLTGLDKLKLSDGPDETSSNFINSRISGYPSALVAKALSLSRAYFSIDAACASSLYSVKIACDYLLHGKADMMLAGAVSAGDPFFVNMGFSTFTAYPEKDESRPLDRHSAGLVSGEGAGMLVLKRLDDALQDKDKIYATISGIGLSNDGRGKSVLSPNAQGQILAYERAYADTQVKPEAVSYIECHATGTPVGDPEEIASLDQFFGRYGAKPLIGSVKANFGHLLTAAGMASMIKVILSMAEQQIPATINLVDPVSSSEGVISAEQVVGQNTPWPGQSSARVGAVNAFGFGGTNAHMVFERQDDELLVKSGKSQQKRKHSGKKEPLQSMAIVGMDAHFGSSNGLDAFDYALYSKKQQFRELPAKRWKGIDKQSELLTEFGFKEGKSPRGSFIEDFSLDVLRYKIPPNEVESMIPQQLLMMNVADRALKDANVKEGAHVAVLIAMESDPTLHQFRGRIDLGRKMEQSLSVEKNQLDQNQVPDLLKTLKDTIRTPVQVNEFTSFIGNIMASRIASVWDFSGPAFTVSSEENSAFKALEVAQMLLSDGEVEAVVVGGVDLAGNVEDVLLRNQLMTAINPGKESFGFEKETQGWMVGEGAGAIVLKLSERAKKEKDRCYAMIDNISFKKADDAAGMATVCEESLQSAGLKPSDIGYLEVTGTEIGVAEKIGALVKAYETSSSDLSCAVGSVTASFGHCFAALGMASVIKTALALYRRYIPAVPGWDQPQQKSVWDGSPFYVETESKSWHLDSGLHKRTAAVFGTGLDGTAAHLVLSEDLTPKKRSSNLLKENPLRFYPVAASEKKVLIERLVELRSNVTSTRDLTQLSAQQIDKVQQNRDEKYVLIIVGGSRDKLLQEIDAGLDGVENAFQQQQEWVSPAGSYFTPQPLGKKGKVAFVYPGAFNSYLGMGKDLFQIFPELYDLVASYADRPETMLRDRLVNPRSLTRLTDSELADKQAELDSKAIAIFETGINAAILNTAVARGVLGVQPDLVFGYSMGEVSMNFAMDVWENTDKMSEFLHSQPIFLERLAGPMKAAREAWGLPPAGPGESEDIWHCYTVSASAEQIQETIASEDHVYLIIINSPNEVVIAGEKEACRRVVEALPYRCVLTPMTDTIHCEIVKPDYESITQLHNSPVAFVPEIPFYSAAGYEPTQVTAEAIADNIAQIYCKTIDFPKLVNRVYEDGARIFLEMGPKEGCSKFIDNTLGEREHLALSMNRKGADDYTNLLKVVSKLLSHRVDLDLTLLMNHISDEKQAARKLMKTITLGGDDMVSHILSAENRSRFGEIATGPSATASGEITTDKEADFRQPETLQMNPAVHPSSDRASQDLSLYMDAEISAHRTQISASHQAFLDSRNASLHELRELIKLQIISTDGSQGRSVVDFPVETTAAQKEIGSYPRVKPAGVIWDEADLLEFAGGKIAHVFGDDYAIIDSYKYRVRLPLPPYLLVNRVTGLNAEKGEFKPSSLTTEYDVPYNAWYSVDGQMPWAIASEAGQCDLLLISYLGIDFQSKGERYYRLTDYTMTFMDELPKEGDTLRYEIRIESFMKFGEALFFNFAYDCFVGERLVYKMTGGRAGFSTNEELAQGKGIVFSNLELENRRNMPKQHFTPLLNCEKNYFEREALLNITRGSVAGCLGVVYDQQGANPSLRFSAEEIMMLDRIVAIDKTGGPWGLGEVIAEKDLAPDHWYFPCHFKDDNVMAGTLITEGCVQLLEFYMLYLGLQVHTQDARFQPIKDRPYTIRARGQIVPTDTLYSYRMEIVEVGLSPRPFARANFYIIMNDRIIVDFQDLGIEMVEKNPVEAVAEKPAQFVGHHIDAFATGSLSECFGPEYDIYENIKAPRTPNGDLQLISRVLSVEGQRHEFKKPSSLVSEYDVPADAWFYRENSYPVMPYSIIMEIALQPCGFLSTYMGATMIYSGVELCFRNLGSDATLISNPDLRGRTITSWAKLLNVSKAAETILLNFDYTLEVEGERFYEGTTLFGYHTPKSLSMQVGLDKGQKIPSWSENEKIPLSTAIELDLKSDRVQENYFQSKQEKPFYRLNGPQLDFLDRVWIFENSGKYGLGYILATKKVDPTDWFYSCHFFQDPVMPGSLGVESIIQAMRIFALQQDLGKEMTSPVFVNVPGVTHWTYRGQITPVDETMDIEVHIKKIEKNEQQITLLADASLWKNKIRIYEVTDAAIALMEA